MTYREQLLALCGELGISDEEAGEPNWQTYLNDRQLAEAIRELRPDATVPEQEQS